MNKVKFLVVLDTMWGENGISPNWFPISPYNHSGKRLYKLTQSKFPEVWVTNCCPEQTNSAKKYGNPSVEWLIKNLEMLDEEQQKLLLMVCGNRSKLTFNKTNYKHKGPILFIAHPAARNWTKEKINQIIDQIKNIGIINNE